MTTTIPAQRTPTTARRCVACPKPAVSGSYCGEDACLAVAEEIRAIAAQDRECEARDE